MYTGSSLSATVHHHFPTWDPQLAPLSPIMSALQAYEFETCNVVANLEDEQHQERCQSHTFNPSPGERAMDWEFSPDSIITWLYYESEEWPWLLLLLAVKLKMLNYRILSTS